LAELTSSPLESTERAVFRGSVGSAYGKELRWTLERDFGGLTQARYVTRNQILNGSVDLYINHAAERTEVLNEYFLPPQNLAPFLERVKEIVPRHGADLLNVTLRDVRKDPDSFLRYADQNVIAVVMLFNQAHTQQADSATADLTRELIDVAGDLGGRYYLPYRPYATLEQFARAYPQATDFFARKQQFDPAMLFQSRFFIDYGAPLLRHD
jgi:FAD/FMN-containing dehydrogenase